jgi:hypothetical protein
MKQETLKEAAKKRYIEGVYVINGIDICDVSRECFIAGANYQAEKMYSEEEVIELLQKYRYDLSSGKTSNIGDTTKFWFAQIKKKLH